MSKKDVPSFLKFISKEFEKNQTEPEKRISDLIIQIKKNGPRLQKYFALKSDKSASLLSKANTEKISGNWNRGVALDYFKKPLSIEGSLKSNGRFHERGQETIYLASTPDTVTRELQFEINKNATALFAISVKLQAILDLSIPSSLDQYKIDQSLFQWSWKSFNNLEVKYYTQYLSDYLRTLPLEGFLYESTKHPNQKCLCLFPNKLLRGSSLKVTGKYADIEKKDMTLIGLN
jgi:RES domain-containing protein